MRLETPDGPVDLPVKGLDRAQYQSLLDAHPPVAGGPWNEVTFPPALIAECTGFPIDEATVWWNETPEPEAFAVFDECLRRSTPGSYEWATSVLLRNSRREEEVRAAMTMGIPLSVFLGWPQDDQDFALARLALDAERCPGCSTPVNSRHRGEYAVKRRICGSCAELEDARALIPEDQRGYTHVSLIRVDQ